MPLFIPVSPWDSPLVQVFGKLLPGVLKFAELSSSHGFIEDDGLKPRGLVE
jgi:hypothetical protein